MQFAPGSRLGPFEITARIGAGGMGEVWAAADARLNRNVAIKVLPESVARDADRLRRFEQEARAAGALNHPNLVTIFDVGTHDTTAYVVMELLEGETLREKIGDGDGGGPRIPIRKVIDYGTQIALGLSAAHEKGIVHRDLKPENIFVTKDGRLKILDFGLAKLDEPSAGASGDDRTEVRGTSPGTVLGTAGYMAPEQVRGARVDHRTDIFSLGAVVYEMLAGRSAFAGHSAADRMSAILKEDPPAFDDAKTPVPPGLDRIVRRCIEKAPDERFQSAHDIAFALEAVSSTSAQRSLVEFPSSRRRLRFVAALVSMVILTAATTAAIVWRMARHGAGLAAALPANVSFTPLTYDSGERMPSLSPDGKTFAFTSAAAGRDDVYVQRVDGRNAINLTKEAAAASSQPAFSPDGEQIAFRSEREGGGIFIMGATGESLRRLSDIGCNPSWSPDGKEIVVGTNAIDHDPRARSARSVLWVIDVRTGAKRQILKTDGVQPSWSPHGARIAYWGIYGEGGQRDLWTIDPHASDPEKSIVRLTDDRFLDWSPLWSADGEWLYFGSDRGGPMNLWRLPLDEHTGVATGAPQPVTLPAAQAGQFTVARNTGDLAYASFDQTDTLWSVPFDPAGLRVTGDPVIARQGTLLMFSPPNPSPDGQWWVFSNSGAQEDLYIMKRDGSGLRQLTNDAEKDRGPSFSSDGKEIYFYSQRGGRYELYAIRPDGSGLRQLSMMKGRAVWYPLALPGRNALIAFNEEATFILPFDADGKITRREPLPPIDATGKQLRWSQPSADGSMIVGQIAETGPQQGVWLYSVATKEYRRIDAESDHLRPLPNSTRFIWNVRWLPNSNRYLIAASPAGLRVIDLNGGGLRDVRVPLRGIGNLSLTSDGKTLLLTESSDKSAIWMMHGGAK